MIASLILLGHALALLSPVEAPRIVPEKNPRRVQVIAKLSKPTVAKLPKGRLTQEQGERWLQFSLVDAKSGKVGPPAFGRYDRTGNQLTFRPRFVLVPEQTYRATRFTRDNTKTTADYTVPPLAFAPAPRITQIFPTAATLPANNLKFYIYFSRPMRGGKDIFEQIYLVDEKGQKIRDPWLRDELWDRKDQRLLIYIHPGRIKWGLLLRRLLGPVLLPRRRYTLVVSGDMLDRDGRKLGKDYKYAFQTSPEHRQRIHLGQWRLTAPQAASRQPLTLDVPMPLDQASMKKLLHVVDTDGKKVAGWIVLTKGERRWTFHPAKAWRSVQYALVIDRELEDVAGNNPIVAFDRDATKPLPPRQRLRLPFRPAEKTGPR